jgi:hypothetical protein
MAHTCNHVLLRSPLPPPSTTPPAQDISWEAISEHPFCGLLVPASSLATVDHGALLQAIVAGPLIMGCEGSYNPVDHNASIMPPLV